MSGQERREQLLDVARTTFAELGYEATSIEEIAAKAGISKPVVYEHFGGKQGIYAVVVDREMQRLLDSLTAVLSAPHRHPRALLEAVAVVLFRYIEDHTDGFRVLVRDSPLTSSGSLGTLLGDVASQVEHLVAAQLEARGYETAAAAVYSQALVGMVALAGQWWLDARSPDRDVVVSQLVNLAWNGLAHLEASPRLRTIAPITRSAR